MEKNQISFCNVADYQRRQARIQEKAIAQATAKKLESEKKTEKKGGEE